MGAAVVDIAVLLSAGRHPASGRSRPGDVDSRALEIALKLVGRSRSVPGQPLMTHDGTSGARLHAVHAGNACEPALEGYLGMGIPEIGVLEVEEGADPLPALIEHLSMLRPALVLTGTVSERGESSGYLPYAVAKALDYAIIANVVALTIGEEVEV